MLVNHIVVTDINNLLETKKELENKIKMAASKKKKSLTAPNISPPLSQEVVCCVPLCTNTSFVTKNKIFFPFPMVKKLWVSRMNRGLIQKMKILTFDTNEPLYLKTS